MMRGAFQGELEQLRLQVDVMAIHVDQNLERMRAVLEHGDASAVEVALAHDDVIDAMNVSLTERCYEIIARESPVADDLRFIVSVLRLISELERIGDLALRVVNLLPDRDLLVARPRVFDVLVSMQEVAIEAYRAAGRAWSALDLELATATSRQVRSMELHHEQLMVELLRLEGPGAVRCATAALIAGRSLDRIADHAAIVGARIRYLLTGDPDHLTAEVR